MQNIKYLSQNILIHPPIPTNTSGLFVVSPYPAPPTMPAPKCSPSHPLPVFSFLEIITVLVTVRLYTCIESSLAS